MVFDPAEISYDELLRLFWESHDPTQGMRQGNDVGTQYRSGIYVTSDAQREAARGVARALRSEQLARGRLRRDHHRDRATRPSSSTPRTTTSSTWRRTRTATAAWAAPACRCPVGLCTEGPSREQQPAPSACRRSSPRRASAPTSAGHQAQSSCSASGTGSAPSGTVASPTSIAMPSGRPTSASTLSRSGSSCHSSLQLARERPRRALAEVDRAAGAERPAVRPGRHPAGAPARQPAAVGGAHHAERGQAVAGVALDQPQRPARRLKLEPQPAARPRASPRAAWPSRRARASRARAAVDGRVGLRRRSRRAARRPRRASAPRPARGSRGRARACRNGTGHASAI